MVQHSSNYAADLTIKHTVKNFF